MSRTRYKFVLPAAIILTMILLGGGLYLFMSGFSTTTDTSTIKVLIIGNSFTYQNNLDKMVGELMTAQYQGAKTIETDKVAFGGYRLYDHWDDYDESDPNSNIRTYLQDGSLAEKDWDVIIFQEQVELPGLPTFEESRQNSLFAVEELGLMAHINGSDVILLETWANAFHPDDPDNPYPEFFVMQNQIAEANLELMEALNGKGVPSKGAHAGDAFLAVYNDVLASGGDPYADGSWFRVLYSEDLEHASVAGSYLAAAVVTATHTGQPISNTDWVPPGIEPDFAEYLRATADRVASE